MTEQQRFVKKPVEISATQWFRNGDHPLDHHPMDTKNPTDEDRKRYDDYLATEGKVVRYYRHPEVSGKATCQKCGNVMHRHGWIDTLEGGHIVCPGDWIITGVQGEHYPCKPDIFEATYQPAGDQHPDDAAVDRFATAMKAKLAKKRADGRGGWQTASEAHLSALLHEHVAKGDPVDVANLAMMLHQIGQRVAALSHAEGEAVGEITIDKHGDAHFRASLGYLDLDQGTYELYTHPAPQVAEEHIPVPRALVERWANVDAFQAPKGAAMELKTIAQQMLVNFDAKAPKTAPQVAVPEQRGEAVATVRDERATVDRLSVDDLRRICMLPAGTKLYTHSAPAGEQPVSDPDGLGAERARRLETATVAKLLLNAWAESEPDHPVTKHPASYAETFTDMAKAMMPLMAAPDEREIAARAIERAVGDYFKAEDGPHNLHDYLLWRVNRLRAGKEGE